MLSTIEKLTSVLFYLPGPFTNNLLKTLAFTVFSTSSYAVAYSHFKRDHNDPFDIFLHLFGLSSTALFCFGMLESLDRRIFSSCCHLKLPVSLSGALKLVNTRNLSVQRTKKLELTACWPALTPRKVKAIERPHAEKTKQHLPILCLTTLVAWIVLLIFQTDSPIASRIVACGLLTLMYIKRSFIADNWAPLSFYSAVIQGCGYAATYGVKDPGFGTAATFDWMTAEGGFYLAKFALLRVVYNAAVLKFLRGKLKGYSVQVAIVILPILAYLSVEPLSKSKGGLLFFWEFVGVALAATTENPVFYFHGAGFTANVLQSVAHKITGETGTLVLLHNLQDEVSHSIYFPLLLVHRIQEAIC